MRAHRPRIRSARRSEAASVWTAILVTVFLVAASCSGGGSSAKPSATPSRSPAASPSPKASLDSGVIRIDPKTLDPKTVMPLDVPNDGAIAAGLGGVWVTSGRELIHLDPKSGRQVGTVDLEESGGSVAAGHALVWVIEGSAISGALHPTLIGVGPSTGEVSVRTPDQDRGLMGLVAGEEGLWATNTAEGTVMEFDSLTGKVRRTLRVDSWQSEQNIAAGFGAVWVVDRTNGVISGVSETTHKVGRFDLKAAVFGVAAGDDAIWVTDDVDGVLEKLPLDGSKAKTIALQPGAGPVAIGEGAVWVGSSQGDTLWRVDQDTLRVKTILLDGRPLDISVGEGAVWVLFQ